MADRGARKGSVEVLILALLSEHPRHGYDLAKLIEARSAGAIKFHVASLYPTLYRLERRLQGRSGFSDGLPQRPHAECRLEVDLPAEQGKAWLDRTVRIGGIGPGRFMNSRREQLTDRLDGAGRETRPVLRHVGIQRHQDAFGLDD